MTNPLQNLHWFNLPDIETPTDTLDNPFLVATMKLTGLGDRPIFIFMGNSKLPQIENIAHNNAAIKHLNTVGVHIFLYEPLCQYVVNQNHNRQFFSEHEFEVDPSLMRADELDSIDKYIAKNNLTRVYVHTCDYRVKQYFPYYSSRMALICDDLFLKNYSLFESHNSKRILKKFISVNWRHAKHRHLVATFLAQASSNYSWYFTSTQATLNHGLWFDLNSWETQHPKLYNQILTGLEILNSNCPTLLDIKNSKAIHVEDGLTVYYPQSQKYSGHNNPAIDNPRCNTLQKFYNESFCDVINETRFAQHTGNFSEKLYQAIRYKTPFILVAPPETLEYAKKYGFKTFSDFWDESYDTTSNHEQRLIKIFNLINLINSKSLNELQAIYSSMSEVLEHNYNILLEKTPYKTVQKSHV
jgi:hypothetical protein